MFKSIEVVRKGDNIKDTYLDGNRRLKVEKGPGTDVSKIEHRACSSLGTHINSRECYAPGAVVWVTESKPKEEIEEQPPIEMRDYALYDAALSTTGLGEILTVDGKPYLNAENARVAVGLVSVNEVRQLQGLSPL